jgi:hypothetical protein
MKPCPVAVAFFLSVLPPALVAPSAWGQAASEDPTTNVARARFKEGVDYYDKGQYEQARAAFLQAYALKKHPAVLINLAWSCLKGGHALEAERAFRQYLADSKEINEKQRADANDGLTQARAKLGRIDVTAPAGTEVTIDAEAVGTAPLADGVAVEPGPHTVKMRGPDGAVETESVSVGAGEKVSARFNRASTVAPGPVSAPPIPAPPAEAAPSPPPAAEGESGPGSSIASPSASPPGPTEHGEMSVAPFFVAGGLVLAGAFVAVYWGVIAKNAAQDNANSTGQGIRDVEAKYSGLQNATCSPPPTLQSASLTQQLAGACSIWNSDNDAVNKDATVGNIGLAVGIAGFAGTFVYSIIYAVNKSGPQSSALPVLAPVVGRNGNGLMLSGTF